MSTFDPFAHITGKSTFYLGLVYTNLSPKSLKAKVGGVTFQLTKVSPADNWEALNFCQYWGAAVKIVGPYGEDRV